MASEIVQLASSSLLPQPMEKQRHMSHIKEVKRSAHLAPNTSVDNVALAPYQALPITGPVVAKEQKSSGLPVLEPDHSMTPEVGAGTGVCNGQRKASCRAAASTTSALIPCATFLAGARGSHQRDY